MHFSTVKSFTSKQSESCWSSITLSMKLVDTEMYILTAFLIKHYETSYWRLDVHGDEQNHIRSAQARNN